MKPFIAAAALVLGLFGGQQVSADQPLAGIEKASKIIGKHVKDANGQHIGEIKDLAIDAVDGEVEYAVLSFGGILGIGDKYFAIPWDALKLDTDRKNFILDVKKKDLKNAPGFDKKNWPDFSDQEVLAIYEFYEMPPPEPPKNSEARPGKANP
jgi:sporulation protein YlmC with PRC-barrel domain